MSEEKNLNNNEGLELEVNSQQDDIAKPLVDSFLADDWRPDAFLQQIKEISPRRYEDLLNRVKEEIKQEVMKEVNVDKEVLESFKRFQNVLIEEGDIPRELLVDEEGNELPKHVQDYIRDLTRVVKEVKKTVESSVSNSNSGQVNSDSVRESISEFENGMIEFLDDVLEKKGVNDEFGRQVIISAVGRLFLLNPKTKEIYDRAIGAIASQEGKLVKKYEVEAKKAMLDMLSNSGLSDLVAMYSNKKKQDVVKTREEVVGKAGEEKKGISLEERIDQYFSRRK